MLRGLLVVATLLLSPQAAAPAAPAVTVLATPTAGPAPLSVRLEARGDAVDYRWELGDGTSATGAVVTHVYARPGRYVTAVTATGATGETARAEVVVTAYALSLRTPQAATLGTPMRFTGALSPPVAGARIVIARDGRAVTAVRTDARGEFTASLRAVAAGVHTARFGEVVSPSRRIALRPQVDAAVEGTGVVGGPLRLVARVRPASAGRLEVVVVRNGKRAHAASYGGSARVGLHSAAPGSFRIELRVVPAEGYAAARRTLRTAVVEPQLGPGSRGAGVLALERRLLELRYVLPRADAHYGTDTYEAVLAFQKVQGLPRTGRVDARVWQALRAASPPRPRYGGTHIEVSKGRQLLFVVRDGKVEAALHVSTGATGNTPLGDWRIYRKVPGWDWILWYPMYFLRGFAIHGYPEVPAHPASRGCVRVPMWYAPQLYTRFGHGQLVRIYW